MSDAAENKDYQRNAPSPAIRRERRLERYNYFFFVMTLVLLVGYILYTTADVFRPRAPVVVDYATGEIKGEYRTTSFRTQTEMVTGGVRFVDHFLSLNSARIREDQYIAMMMMSGELRDARMQYLEETDLLRKIEAAGSSSHLEYSEKTILVEKGEYMKIEYVGNIVLTGLNRTNIPFDIIVELKMNNLTDKNTSGVLIVGYRDF